MTPDQISGADSTEEDHLDQDREIEDETEEAEGRPANGKGHSETSRITIRGEDSPRADMANSFSGAPIVGTAPDKQSNDISQPLYQGSLLTSTGTIVDIMAAERFRILRAKVERHNLGENRAHVIAVTSAVPEEGKSFNAVNLARAFGVDPTGRTLLIDCDLRRPTVHEYFQIPLLPGLTDVLVGGRSIHSVIRPQANGVDVITAGTPVNDPAAVLEQPIFARYLHELKKRYRYVIIDGPPVLVCPEPITLSMIAEATLLVVRAWSTDRRVVQDAVKAVGKNRILGTILNEGSDPAESYSYYRYYGYGNTKKSKKVTY
jgi:capsular exopolysaccharide synthesis family protein